MAAAPDDDDRARRGLSPWITGALAIGWLAAVGSVAGGASATLTAWAATVGLALLLAGRIRRAPTLSPPQPAPPAMACEPAPGAAATDRAAPSSHGPPTTATPQPDVGGWSASLPVVGATVSDPSVLTADEVAHLLRLPAAHIAHALKNGELPGNCVDGQWRVLQSSLLRWLDGEWAPPR